MKNPQQLDFEKQLKRLSEYGIKCTNDNHDIHIETLKSIGYYDLKRFAFPFNIAKHKGKANFKNISFDQLVTRYYQDKNLRIYILHAIECIEVYLENSFAYILGKEYGPFGYLNFSSWCDRKNNERFYIEEQQYFFKKNLLKKMKYASNPSTTNQKNLRDGFPTVWLMVNTLTLGQLKKYIELASPQNRKNLAFFFKVNNVTLESWIDCLVLVRNICCHNSDLIDIKLKTHPKVPKKYTEELYKDSNNRYSDRIGIVIFIIVSMMNYINPKYDFGNIYRSFKAIFKKNNKLANQLGFSNYNSINALPRTRDHKSKKNKPSRT